MTAARALGALLWPRWRGALNAPRSKAGGRRGRLLVIGLLAATFMGLSFVGTRWLFTLFLQAEFLAELLIQRVLDMVLLVFTGLLVFSSTVTAFGTFFLADDLPLLATAPTPVGRLVLARLVDTWLQSSWMILVFAAPMMAACGPVLGAGPAFYVALPLVLLPLTVLAASLGVMITLLLARALPAQRTQEILAVLGVLAFLVLYVVFRAAQPERFVQPDAFQDLVAVIADLEAGSNALSPSTWVVGALFPVLRGAWLEAASPAAVLFTSAPAAVALTAWLGRRTWRASFAKVQEGKGDTDRGVWQRLGRLLRRRPARYVGTPVGALVDRDRRMFFRATGQWSQLLLVAALVAVYVFNFRYFRVLRATGVLNEGMLFVAHVLVGGLVLTTVAVRFLYPAVSLEGRAFWAVQAAPVPMRAVLAAKVRAALGPMILLGLGLALAAEWMVDLAPATVAGTVGVSLLAAYALAGLAVGLGALDPRFDEPNPARIASGLGGVGFMVLGMLYLVAVTALLGWPVAALRAILDGWSPPLHRWLKYGGLFAGALALTALTHHLPLWWGARSLERREP
ncbi:MAG: hypothetical protein H6702_08625 [Myxococcales bacterium]|nr:hypothetical protein [Myxococcales bacterium]